MSSSKKTRSSVALTRSTTECNAVSWSQDQRIAVTSSQAIYIMTLKRPQVTAKLAMESVTPTLPSPQISMNPLLVINTALAPLKEKLCPLNIGNVSQGSVTMFPWGAMWNMVDLVDPMLVTDDQDNQSHDFFKASYWSPAGYNHLGGCVLTALTASGRLLLYTPPGNTSSCWKMALDIGSHHASLLYPPETPSPEPQAKKPKATKSSKTPKSVPKKTTKNGHGNGCGQEAAVTNGESSEAPRPKRVKLASKTGLSEEYRLKRLSVACTACAWLPTLLQVNREVIGIIAMATRTGHVTLLGVKLPIVLDKIKENPVSLIGDYQLPLSGSDEDQEGAWSCSLCWLPSVSTMTTPTFYMSPGDEGCVFAHLIVGCTSGQVFDLQWELSGVNGIVGLVASSISSINGVTGVCSITGVSGVTGRVSEITKLWEKPDGVAVFSIACQSKFLAGGLWVVFSKSNLLVAQCLDDSYQPVGAHVTISGQHKMTVSGLSTFSDFSFISSSLDGTVQTFCLESAASTGHVTPSPVTMATQSDGHGVRAQGVAVSEMGIFAAIAVNIPEHAGLHSRYFPKKFRTQSQLHFVTVSTSEEVEAMIGEDTSSRWDICEFLRRNYGLQQEEHTFLPSVRDMLIQLAKGRVIPGPKLQLLHQATIISGKKEAILRSRECIIHRHVVSSLRSWLEWEKRPQGMDTPTEEEEDTQSQTCVQLMSQWLLSCANHPTVTETKLANKIRTMLPAPPKPPGKSKGQSSPPGYMPLEVCEACQEPVPLTGLLQGTCLNGHTWSRCGVTLCLAVDSRCSSCIQCGSIVNNALTINVAAGSWLNSLLQKHSCCIFCGGYFEQVI